MPTDKLDSKLPLIAKLLRVVLGPSTPDAECSAAFWALQHVLEEVDPGGHELVERIKAPVVAQEDLQRILEAGRAQGRAEEAARRQRAVAVVTSLASNNDDDDLGGYSSREVVGYCLANRHRIRSDWEANIFLPSVAQQLSNPFYNLSPRQTPIVWRIFKTWFQGEIT